MIANNVIASFATLTMLVPSRLIGVCKQGRVIPPAR